MSYSPNAPQYDEAAIKAVLDGTFTRVNYEGRVITEAVEPDFLPSCAGGDQKHRGKNVKPQAYWSQADDDTLLTMRFKNRPFAEIAWILDRTEEATKKRYRVLRVKGRVMV